MFLGIVLSVCVMATGIANADVPFISKTVFGDQIVTISGVVEGLDVGPADGKFEIFITNKKFKGEYFTELKCKVHKELATPMAEKFKNSAVLEVSFFKRDGTLGTAIGYVAGMIAIPENGLVVKVKNRIKNDTWNLLKCKMK